ncbi:MAG: ArsR/SmtB family transcription factor [Candidatus Hodarchaeales archaeon]
MMTDNEEITGELETRIQQYIKLSNCSCSSVHDHLSVLLHSLPSEQKLYHMTNIFKALSNIHRVKILFLLLESPKCNCEIEGVLKLSQSTISHHLSELSKNGFIKIERKGKWSINVLNEDFKAWIGSFHGKNIMNIDITDKKESYH